MIPREILYWSILLITVVAAIWAILSFSNITDQVKSDTSINSRGLVPVEEGLINNSL